MGQIVTFLIGSSLVVFCVTCVFLIKLLFDCSKLISNLNDTVNIVKPEVKPLVKNLSDAATTVNSMVQETNSRIGKVSSLYDKTAGAIIDTVAKVSIMSGSFIRTIVNTAFSTYKIFAKKK